MRSDDIERVEQLFKQRYERKKFVNLIISAIIVLLGVASVIYIWNFDGDGVLTFRWMTVDGTIFTTVIALFYVVVNILEIARYTELTSKVVYFARLAAAVAESIIMVVVLLSQLPFSPEHMHIFRFDMFNMHLLIPVLMVASFILNDSPIGRLKPLQKFHGTWFVSVYAVVILTLIGTGVISSEQVPYFFLDFLHIPALMFIGCFLFIYTLAYVLAHFISKWNRKLSWVWFKNITRK